MTQKITAVILAAGKGTRFTDPNTGKNICKLTLPYKNTTLIEHVIAVAQSAGINDITVMTGHYHSTLTALLSQHPITLIHNEKYAKGMSETLKLAARNIPNDTDGVLFMLGDMPLIQSDTLKDLIAAFSPEKNQKIIIPTSKGKRGNPLLWSMEFLPEFQNLTGDQGAKKILPRHQDSIYEITLRPNHPELEIFQDIDCDADYQLLLTLPQ